ncbi:uncharacterized protein MELLADRAFT_68895 [Melampsora larici-populina 98AG31]|uniref:Uncharacterized protein n=1 Tax=Melampsora larici-populina (strain 98AG31 / pathotype 3-4-7) TaxID=747676 RepID=F4S8H2_MELLP|nr:uncharacterized protein MELLADRAFT_68895 [Melampsora larici-populina 98AG31]EGF99040.1 hypothetical protein MELLADRAFT_68895 [Melampsora larici-populina 98AG31]
MGGWSAKESWGYYLRFRPIVNTGTDFQVRDDVSRLYRVKLRSCIATTFSNPNMSFRRHASKPRPLDRLPSSPTHYAPLVSSPLVTHCTRSSSPVSYVSSSCDPPMASSPVSGKGYMPLSDLIEPEPASDDTEMQLEDTFVQSNLSHLGQPSIGNFHPSASSSPGPSWLPTLAAPRTFPNNMIHSAHSGLDTTKSHRSASFKQPIFHSSHRSSPSQTSDPPSSSPTPGSKRAFKSRFSSPQGSSSPSRLRQQAASRIRENQRKGLLTSRRILLEGFLPGGTDQMADGDWTAEEFAILEATDRKENFNARRRWTHGLNEEQLNPDELIAEEEMMGEQYDELPPDEDSDPSQIYAAYQSGENALNCDDYNPQLGQQQASDAWRSLGDILTTSPAICPACHTSGLGPTQSSPPDVQCRSCAWSLSSETLSIIDQEFLNHGLVDMFPS